MPRTSVRTLEVTAEQSGRRLDNYLSGILKNVPKSFIYKIIRRGEVRVNGSRSRPDRKLAVLDLIRIPPMIEGSTAEATISNANLESISRRIIFENDNILVINKPSGLAVHGGSGLRFGVIDIVRNLRPEPPAIELVHRLDRDTSGCLVFTKNYPSLRLIQHQMSSPASRKTYLVLIEGELSVSPTIIDLRLSTKRLGGENRTVVASDGKHASTKLTELETFGDLSLVRAQIATGRTHQIRVHAASAGHAIAGDKRYGDRTLNERLRRRGLHRMFLHANSITLRPGRDLNPITLEAPLPKGLNDFVEKLRCST